jgi:hypothetical protein
MMSWPGTQDLHQALRDSARLKDEIKSTHPLL